MRDPAEIKKKKLNFTDGNRVPLERTSDQFDDIFGKKVLAKQQFRRNVVEHNGKVISFVAEGKFSAETAISNKTSLLDFTLRLSKVLLELICPSLF